jgi:hypothetical protein
MSDIPFHATIMGRRFYERDVPSFLEQLRALNANLEKLAALMERGTTDQPEVTK